MYRVWWHFSLVDTQISRVYHPLSRTWWRSRQHRVRERVGVRAITQRQAR